MQVASDRLAFLLVLAVVCGVVFSVCGLLERAIERLQPWLKARAASRVRKRLLREVIDAPSPLCRRANNEHLLDKPTRSVP